MKTKLAIALATTAITATTAMAQTAFTSSTANDQLETLNENIQDDFSRETTQFGNQGRTTGFQGSFALQASATAGNTDTVSLGAGANFGYYDGQNGYDLQLSYQYAEDEGVVSEDSLVYELQYTRDLGTSYYGFAQLHGSVDSIPFDTSDNFLGVGLGYRIYDTADTQWSVQAGVGYRVADLNGLDDLGEGALSLSSNYYNQLTETVAISNDTDIISSESDTVVFNDLGLNVSMTETLALRTSVVTEYHSDPEPGKEDTDNTFGVSLVYNFD